MNGSSPAVGVATALSPEGILDLNSIMENIVFVCDVPSDDDDDDDGDNVQRRKAKKLKPIRRQPLGDIINFGINLENKHAGTESTPSDDIGLLSKEMATKHVHAASIKNKLDLSIKKNEIYQLKAIIAQLKATMLRKDQEATALKETVAKIKEDYESVALDHATAAIALTRLTEEAAELNNIIASSSVQISQNTATVTNVIATYKDIIAILRLENKKKTEEAAALNNIITSSSVQISQFKLEVSTLAEERDQLTMRLNEEDQGKECVVCKESRKACLFLPCRHMCVCEGCASLIQANDRKCPLCRTVSEQVMRVFH